MNIKDEEIEHNYRGFMNLAEQMRFLQELISKIIAEKKLPLIFSHRFRTWNMKVTPRNIYSYILNIIAYDSKFFFRAMRLSCPNYKAVSSPIYYWIIF